MTDAKHVTVHFAVPSPDNALIAECQIQKRPENMEDGMSLGAAADFHCGHWNRCLCEGRGQTGGNIRLTASVYYHEKIRDIKTVEFVPYGTYEVADAISRNEIDVAVLSGSGSDFDPFYDAKQFTIYENQWILYFICR